MLLKWGAAYAKSRQIGKKEGAGGKKRARIMPSADTEMLRKNHGKSAEAGRKLRRKRPQVAG